MSTSENNGTPPLTRRQLREIRNTGATPIIPTPPVEPAVEAAPEPAVANEPAVAPEPAVANEPAIADDSPVAHDERTADGQPATPDEPTSHDDSATPEPPVEPDAPVSSTQPAQPVTTPEPAVIGLPSSSVDDNSAYAPTGLTRRQVRAQEKIRTASVPVISPDLTPAVPGQSAPTGDLPAIFRPAVAEEPEATEPVPAPPVSSTVNPELGSDLLNGATPDISLPPSFDQLIARSGAATGSVSTPNALILSDAPVGGPLVAPVTATGEVMITGTFELPQGLGSVGHAPGTTDGREADAVLLDGELPAASSPTPIAASAAISTVKQPGDIIRPPAPEKGSKLVIGLIITTGALAIAVAVALAIAVTTGVFG